MVVMTLLVRDEVDICEANLEFHLSHGVDHVIATDNGSTDGTRDLLVRYQRSGVVTLIDESGDDFSQAVWVTRMARLAYENGADWVINSDADEFWWPEGEGLKDYFASVPADVDVVAVPRDDFVATDLPFDSFAERMLWRKSVSTAFGGTPLPPKAAHRGHPSVNVTQGNHAAIADGFGPRTDLGRLRILHFPIRSYDQIERRIVTGGQAYERNDKLPATTGHAWRALFATWQEGGLRSYYDEQLYDESRLRSGVSSGDLRLDTRLRDWLRSHEEGDST